ncbi:MAG TPA: NUDIX hydrolase [Abditibacteriaceae bacterium]|jgi:ADP-ribose pyrophosphatase
MLSGMTQNEETISTRRIHDGRVVRLREDIVRLPSGREAKREVLEHNGAVCIVAVESDGRIVLVRQFRKPAEAALLEIPAGGLEAGETPEECARRELSEECNLQGARWTPLFKAYLAPGYSTELMYGFLAEDLSDLPGTPDEDENVEVERYTVDELLAMIDDARIMDAKTICGVLAYARRKGL